MPANPVISTVSSNAFYRISGQISGQKKPGFENLNFLSAKVAVFLRKMKSPVLFRTGLWSVRVKKMHAEILDFQYFEPLFAYFRRTFPFVFLYFLQNRLRAKKMQGNVYSKRGFSSMKFSKVSAWMVYIIVEQQRSPALWNRADGLCFF